MIRTLFKSVLKGFHRAPSPSDAAPAADHPLAAGYPDPFPVIDGIPRPDWERIIEWSGKNIPSQSLPEFADQTIARWLDELADALENDYVVYESPHFFVMMQEHPKDGAELLTCLEKLLPAINDAFDILPSPARRERRRVVMVFEGRDMYWKYISHFYSAGAHPPSGAVALNGNGFPHIAMPTRYIESARVLLAHELSHLLIPNRNAPTWLDEGMAQRMEALTGGKFNDASDTNFRGSRREYWNERKIQRFWSGRSFHAFDEGRHLSYVLGETLCDLLSARPGNFGMFLREASYKDGGAAAAAEHLEITLGAAMAELLGPGDWEPNLKSPAPADLPSAPDTGSTDVAPTSP